MMAVKPENLRKMHTEREHGAASGRMNRAPESPREVLRAGNKAMVFGLPERELCRLKGQVRDEGQWS